MIFFGGWLVKCKPVTFSIKPQANSEIIRRKIRCLNYNDTAALSKICYIYKFDQYVFCMAPLIKIWIFSK